MQSFFICGRVGVRVRVACNLKKAVRIRACSLGYTEHISFMPHLLEEELAGVIDALRNNSEATRLEAWRALNESHNWTDEQFHDFRSAFNALSEDFLRLLERKQHLEREIRASETP